MNSAQYLRQDIPYLYLSFWHANKAKIKSRAVTLIQSNKVLAHCNEVHVVSNKAKPACYVNPKIQKKKY